MNNTLIKIGYFYSPTDARYAKVYPEGSTTNAELYIRNAFGKELLVYNSNLQSYTAYAYGTNRIAHFTMCLCGPNLSSQASRFMFYNHDHLGNTRLTYSTKCVAGVVSLTTNTALDYYPYGKELRAYNSAAEKYKSTHNERDLETGYDYRNARSSTSDAVRFNTIDPMQSKYPSLSPYCYVGGNPVRFVDMDGKRIRFTLGGSKEDFDEAEGILNTYFNNNVTFGISRATGFLEITGSDLSKLTDAQRKVYDYLNEQINAEKEILGHIESNKEFAGFDDYRNGFFDPADVNKLNNPAEEMRLFIHFIAEQSQVTYRERDGIKPTYNVAHAYAVQNDFAVMGFSWANEVDNSAWRAKEGHSNKAVRSINDTVDSQGNVIRSHDMVTVNGNITKLSNVDRSSKETQELIKAFFGVPAPSDW